MDAGQLQMVKIHDYHDHDDEHDKKWSYNQDDLDYNGDDQTDDNAVQADQKRAPQSYW